MVCLYTQRHFGGEGSTENRMLSTNFEINQERMGHPFGYNKCTTIKS